MLEDFVDMDLADLKKIVKIGGGKLKNCYKADTLYNVLRNAADENIPIKDPLTQQRLTEDEIEDVLRKLRIKPKDRPRSRLIYDNSYLYRNPIETEPAFAYLYFRGNNTQSLGVIPMSAILFNKLVELHSKGRLMVNNNTGCCRIHLRKTLDYWKSDNIDRLTTKMIEEIDQLL
jgi:hypothetical protein